MATPPNMVASGLDLDDTAGLPELEVSVDAPMEFPGGAEIIEDGMGGATVQPIDFNGLEGLSQEDLIPFDANLSEFLDDGVLGELSSDLRSMYQDDLSSRSEWEDAYTNGLDLLGIKTEDRSLRLKEPLALRIL